MLSIKNILFHTITSLEAITVLKTSTQGLSEKEVSERQAEFGYNEIQKKEKDSPLKLLLSQFANILIIILVMAAIISAAMGENIEALSIIFIVLLAGILGFVQEYQAGKAIDALQKMAAPLATVIREGRELSVASRELVPGDIIVLKTGDTIPADARIIESYNLQAEESSLTGESQSVEKKADSELPEKAVIGDRINMLFSGTTISIGRGKAVVTATGNETEFGKIAQMLSAEPDRKTPLQENLDSLGSKIGIFAIIVALAMSIAGILKGYSVIKMFVWGVALAVAVIPEALPAVVTISLALGVRRMVKRKALVRKLPAVETLGAVNIICSDKTGTLTEDKMTVRKLYLDGKIISVTGNGYEPRGDFMYEEKNYDIHNDVFDTLAKIGTLCNDSALEKNDDESWSMNGDPTEGALLVIAAKGGIDRKQLSEEFPRVDEIPFSSDRKMMTTLHQVDNSLTSYTKGAGEIIVQNCTRILTAQGVRPLEKTGRQNFDKIIDDFGKQSLRVIGLAFNEDANLSKENAEKDMIFAGFAAMIDPPRPETITAIEQCKSAGIKPVMITGDHKITAVAIAREIGILKDGSAFSGEEIEEMREEEFNKAVEHAEVFARISPAHKMKIVEALMSKNNIVAMTGDGVNDAPSLKKSNIGIAMGITGTDVSKEASDMILTDDNFASIVSAVEEGRTIFDNIRKYLVYLLSGNMGTVLALIGAMAAGFALPLTAVQILFINFVMDGLIAIALGVEKPEDGVMNKKPRKVAEGILNKEALLDISLIGIAIAAVSFFVYAWSIKNGFQPAQAGTMFFITLIVARLFNGLACRSLTRSAFVINPISNPALMVSLFVTLIFVFFIISNSFLQNIFTVTRLSMEQWFIIIRTGAIVILFTEILKIVKKLNRWR